MATFSGKYYYTIDPKGRIMIPAPLREVISANYSPKLYITNAPADKCLNIYPLEEWNGLLEKVRGLPKSNKSVKRYMRNVIGSAIEVNIDKQGRVQVPSSLREDSDIKGDIVIVGLLDKLEVWDRQLWDQAMADSAMDETAFEEELSEFGL